MESESAGFALKLTHAPNNLVPIHERFRMMEEKRLVCNESDFERVGFVQLAPHLTAYFSSFETVTEKSLFVPHSSSLAFPRLLRAYLR